MLFSFITRESYFARQGVPLLRGISPLDRACFIIVHFCLGKCGFSPILFVQNLSIIKSSDVDLNGLFSLKIPSTFQYRFFTVYIPLACTVQIQSFAQFLETDLPTHSYILSWYHLDALPAQLAWSVEYSDYISKERKTPPQINILDMTLNHLMMRLTYWSFRECRLPITLSSTLTWSGSTC